MTDFNLDIVLSKALNLDTMQCENCKTVNVTTAPCCSQCGSKLPNRFPRESECDPMLHYALSTVMIGGLRNKQKFCTQCGEKLYGK